MASPHLQFCRPEASADRSWKSEARRARREKAMNEEKARRMRRRLAGQNRQRSADVELVFESSVLQHHAKSRQNWRINLHKAVLASILKPLAAP